MNFMFATLLGARAHRAEAGRRRAGDRLRAMRAFHPQHREPAGIGPAPRPRAVWRICPATGRPIMSWSAEPQGDGSRSRRGEDAAIRPRGGGGAAGGRHGRSFQ